MKWFNNMKVSRKVLMSCLVFIVLILIISGQGMLSMNNSEKGFNTFYDDRFIPVRQLNRIMRNLLQIRINMLQEQLAGKKGDWQEVQKRIDASKELAVQYQDLWKKFSATHMEGDEQRLADLWVEKSKKPAAARADFAKYLIEEKDFIKSEKALGIWLIGYKELRDVTDKLIVVQQTIGEKLKQEQADSARLVFILSILFLSISIIMGIIITFILARAVSGPVGKGLEFAKRLAEGDFTERIDLDQEDELGQLGKALNKSADNIEGLVSNVLLASENLAEAVGQIASGNENLSQRTSEQASSLEEIASTLEETTATINQNSDNSQKANIEAGKSTEMANEGGTLIRDAVLSINEINETSKKINEIISVINEIAFQTNLLALNASVEAARAGDQGRGFAVVAGEVRNLAQRSGNAAKEIGDLIKDSIDKIEDGTAKANKSGEAITEIIDSFSNVNRLIADTAAASIEQKQGVAQVNTAVTELDDMTQQNAALVEETASASEEMANQAQELLNLMSSFKISADRRHLNQDKKQAIVIHGNDGKEVKGAGTAKKDKNPSVSSNTNLHEIMNQEGFEEF